MKRESKSPKNSPEHQLIVYMDSIATRQEDDGEKISSALAAISDWCQRIDRKIPNAPQATKIEYLPQAPPTTMIIEALINGTYRVNQVTHAFGSRTDPVRFQVPGHLIGLPQSVPPILIDLDIRFLTNSPR